MKICIPTLDDGGLKGTPSDHFGSAPFFTFVDLDTQEVTTVRNRNAHHVHGACQPLKALDSRPVDAIVCRGLGKRAFSRLRGDGIQVYVTLEKDVQASVQAMKDGRLRQLTSQEACHGHSHGHGPGQSHGSGLGVGGRSGLGGRGPGFGGRSGSGPGRGR